MRPRDPFPLPEPGTCAVLGFRGYCKYPGAWKVVDREGRRVDRPDGAPGWCRRHADEWGIAHLREDVEVVRIAGAARRKRT